MAGHSKWANTKHRKNTQDIKRSKLFTKIIKKITISSKKYGSDVNKNFKLRTILEKAHTLNVNKNLINNALKRGAGENKKNIFHTVKYAGYSINGVVIIIHCNTNNSNRTVSNIRNILSLYKGNLTKYNNIQYLFNFFYVIKININLYNKNIIYNLINKNKMVYSKKKYKDYVSITIKMKNFKKIKKNFLSYSITFDQVNELITPKIIREIDLINKKKIINIINLLKKLKETVYITHNMNL
ncbi:Probable transcriptional regulatory protein YebC [Buchnera aphidicola (Cinara piceae)]|uniref:Probable transcriptional regulatory protein YebC n=1 Tax=Buchnera aphidicola (Cinara piceae) TaxID=1660043 RepID=A0A803FTX8_9GAMM|nr:YebC/PmpR family DNA-binding transcriptional regulator [Buchnera aphidicola]VFP88347.1 Probable transcriptional regulatory protein YebC [Buchnera aphidicola (Cinara piceae)]